VFVNVTCCFTPQSVEMRLLYIFHRIHGNGRCVILNVFLYYTETKRLELWRGFNISNYQLAYY